MEQKQRTEKRTRLFALLCAIVPISVSYLGTWLRQRQWKQQLIHPAEDLNIAAAQTIADGYSGISYLTDLLFSDTTVILMLLLSVGFGVLMIRRMRGDSASRCMLVAFRDTAVGCFCGLAALTLVTMLLLPSKGIRPLTTGLYHLRQASDVHLVGIILVQCAIVSLCCALMVALIWGALPYFRRPYLAVGMPIVLFFFLHLLVGGMGYLMPSYRGLLGVILPDSPLLALYTHFSGTGSAASLPLRIMAFPCLTALLCFLIGRRQRERT